jgi:putative transposase
MSDPTEWVPPGFCWTEMNRISNKPPLWPVRKSPIHLPVREGISRAIIISVTVCSQYRKPIFCRQDTHENIIRAWQSADSWHVGRYLVMPDHIHFFCAPARPDYPELRKWIKYWKSIASCAWPRVDEQPVWQRSFWDTQVRDGESYERISEYIRQNPVRKQLVRTSEEWPYQGELHKLPWFG